MATLPESSPAKKRHPISTVLSCRELAEILKPYGDLPLMSGRTDYAITGFKLRDDGLPSTTAVQVELPHSQGNDDSCVEPSVTKEVF